MGRILDPPVVAPLGGAEIGQHLLQAGDHGVGQVAVLVLHAAQAHDGCSLRPALLVDHQGGGRRAVPQQLAPLAQRQPLQRDNAIAVTRQPAGMDMVDDRGRPRRQPHQRAVRRHHRLRHLALPGERRVLDHVADLAMHRQGDLGPDPLVHADQLVARRVARDMDMLVGAVADHLDAARRQRVVQAADRPLVARDHARGEDRGVARLQHQVAVLAGRDLGHRGARLALAAGADEQHLLARQVARVLLR